jgi:hypothetical protein
MQNRSIWPLACGVLLAFAARVHAAGGHFDVDDATLLAPDRCQTEAWFMRSPAKNANVLHLGPGCRLGPVELTLNIDRVGSPADRRSALGPQLKWATDPALGSVSAGLVAGAMLSVGHGSRATATLYVPLTWNISDQLALNVNAGLDRDADGRRTRRHGVSAEWALNPQIVVLAERAEFGSEWVSRIGTRLSLSETLSIDLSAGRVGPQATRSFAIGINHEFGR